MRCLVLLLVGVCCAGTAAVAAAASCSLSEEYFARHNVSADESDSAGPVCGGQCCGRGREGSLRGSLRRRAGARAAAATGPIAELLLSTRRTLQDHLIALSYQSQNKTASFLEKVYRGHATRAHAPLSSLYEDIRSLLRPTLDRDAADDLGSAPPKVLSESVRQFFRDIFPLEYHNMVKQNMTDKQFTPEYEICLRDAYDAVQPYGDVPERLGSSLTRSLEAARTLLQVLAVGAGTLAASEQVLAGTGDEACTSALLRAAGCPRCRGHDARPCKNYCLNVARGCIGSLVYELDAPWAGYVEAVERLSRADADSALRALDARVTEAYMHALEGQAILEKKVRQECGPPSTLTAPPAHSPSAAGPARRDTLRDPPPDTELLQFAAELAASKRIFAGLAERLCEDPDFAAEGDDRCWNGESVGKYTKALVASASVSDQRYNPEVAGGALQDSRVATLGDRLRQARQLLVAHTWGGGGAPAAEAFMQGDEAGEEGSGSGRSYDDDAAYDAEGSGEEGSGSHRIGVEYVPGGIDVNRGSSGASPTSTGSATSSRPLLGIIFSLTLLTALRNSLT